MSPYGKTVGMALGLSTALHAVGAAVFGAFWVGKAVTRPPAPTATVARLILREPPPPPKYEPPKIIPPAAAQVRPLPPQPMPVEPPPPPAAQPKPAHEPVAPIRPPPSRSQYASTAPIAPIPSVQEGVRVALTAAAPAYDYNPKPRYPREARSRGWEGTTILRVEVHPSGEAGQIEIAQSSGYSLLDEAAREAVRSWRFIPARVGDRPVAGAVEVPIAFRLVSP